MLEFVNIYIYILENGYMLLIDIGTKCVFAPIVGMMSDKVGRVPVL